MAQRAGPATVAKIDDPMRAFIAMTLPETVRASLATLQRTLAESRADVKWVKPEHLHVTMKFLGEITEEQRRAVEAMLRQVASSIQPFPLSLRELGAFPSMRAPRVIWVGIEEGKEPLVRLAEGIEREGAAAALQKEERPFAAHVTLGRVRSPKGHQALVQALSEATWTPPPPWTANHVTLYESVLSSSGPTYSSLAEVPVGSA